MEITKEWLQEKDACSEIINWYSKNPESDIKRLIKNLNKEDHHQWASWLLTRIFEKNQNIQYSIFAAEQVLQIFEKKFPQDDRPKKAIEAAKRYLQNPTEKNKETAASAFSGAYSAASAASAFSAVYSAAASASSSYSAASSAAYSAAYSAASAYSDAFSDAFSAASASSATRKKIQIKILNFGLTLLK